MDDLLDLDWSSSSSTAPVTLQPSRPSSTKPAPPASGLKLGPNNPNPGTSASASAFDFLAPSTTSTSFSSKPASTLSPTPPIRSGTPLTAPLPHAARFANSLPPRGAASGASSPVPRISTPSASASSAAPPGASGSGKAAKLDDAFSSLLSLSGPGGQGMSRTASGAAGMSLAERAKAAEREKKEREERERSQFDFDHGAFLGSLAGPKHGAGVASLAGAQRHVGGTGVGKMTNSQGNDDFGDLLRPSPQKSGASFNTASGTALRRGQAAQSSAGPGSGDKAGTKPKSTMGSIWDTDLLVPPPPSTRNGGDAASSTSRPSGLHTNVPSIRTDGGIGEHDNDDDPFDFDRLAAKEQERKAREAREMEMGRGKGVRGGGSRGAGGSGMRTPVSDFDWGEDRLGSAGEQDGDSDEEVLGISNRRNGAKGSTAFAGRSSKSSSARPVSPPPHIVGQIVEMGFSPAQARTALAKTSTGLDVEAAIEFLLGSRPSSSAAANRDAGGRKLNDPSSSADEEGSVDFVQRERARREEEEGERRRARRAGPSRDTIQPRPRSRQDEPASGGGEYADQTEKYLAQASEIGSSMLSKASSFWSAGKEKAQKMLEEQKRAYEARQEAAAAGQAGGSRNAAMDRGGRAERGVMGDGRPRWMRDAEAGAEGEEKYAGDEDSDDDADRQRGGRGAKVEGRNGGGFRDEDDTPPRPSRGNNTSRTETTSSRQPDYRPNGDEYKSAKDRALLAEDIKPYVPASRRKPALSAAEPRAGPSRPITPLAPVQLITRRLVPATPAQLAGAGQAKSEGNEHFKLGRFAESATSYTTGISRLPEGHLQLVPLHNNRAAARLKLGEWEGATADCTAAITIIGESYHPAKEHPLPPSQGPDGQDVRLPDSMVKALQKRAQAYEMGEKYKKALEDWERLMGLDAAFWAAHSPAQVGASRNMAAEGARRARKMLDPPPSSATPITSSNIGTGGSTSTQSRPKPAKSPAVPTSSTSRPPTAAELSKSKGVSNMRAASAALEAEKAEQLSLKDSVDARIANWRNGKEGNIRALIASLDTVLWPEVMSGGVKVGMGELIVEKQVKIRYMKVIAKLHPDKLDTKNTTVEQRMLANGVFSALNDAWVIFQNGS